MLTTSLKMSHILKGYGFDYETWFTYWEGDIQERRNRRDELPAPTVVELMLEIPIIKNLDNMPRTCVMTQKISDKYYRAWIESNGEVYSKVIKCDNICDALAELWVWCQENKELLYELVNA